DEEACRGGIRRLLRFAGGLKRGPRDRPLPPLGHVREPRSQQRAELLSCQLVDVKWVAGSELAIRIAIRRGDDQQSSRYQAAPDPSPLAKSSTRRPVSNRAAHR